MKTPEKPVGKNCPYCQTPVKPTDNVVVCGTCGQPHHLECWNANKGCTTYGCEEAPPVTRPSSDETQSEPYDPRESRVTPRSSNRDIYTGRGYGGARLAEPGPATEYRRPEPQAFPIQKFLMGIGGIILIILLSIGVSKLACDTDKVPAEERLRPHTESDNIGDTEFGLLVLGHESDNITAIAVSNDGTKAIAGSAEGLNFWSLPDGEIIRLRRNPTIDVITLNNEPEISSIAIGTGDYSVSIMDPESYRISREYEAIWAGTTTPDFSCVDVSTLANFTASGSTNGKIYIWDYKTSEWLETLERHYEAVSDLVFYKDDTVLASCSIDGDVIIWDMYTKEVLDTIAHGNRTGGAWDLEYSPDGNYLACGFENESISIWDVNDAYLRLMSIDGTEGCRKLAWGTDNSTMLIACEDSITLFNIDLEAETAVPSSTVIPLNEPVIDMDYRPRTGELLLLFENNEIVFIDLSDAESPEE